MHKPEDLRQGTVTLTPYPWNTSLPMSTKYYSKLTSSVFVQAECHFFMGIPWVYPWWCFDSYWLGVHFLWYLSLLFLHVVVQVVMSPISLSELFPIESSLGVSWVLLSWLTASAPVHVCSLYKFNSSWFPGCAVTLAGPWLWASSWNSMTVTLQFCM